MEIVTTQNISLCTYAVQGAGSVKQQVSNLVALSLRATVPEVDVEPTVEVCTTKFGDYQWYAIGSLSCLLH
jgi:hypothetical protein